MSDSSAHKKGMRTFASDFARAKKSRTTKVPVAPKIPTPESDTIKPPIAVIPTPTIQKPTVPTIPAPSKSKSPATAIPTPVTHSNTSTPAKVPNKIPAFHELQKAVTDIDLSNNEPAPKKSNTKGITPSKRVGGGAIITDTRHNSFSFFSETKKEIISWFKKLKRKSVPKLAVSDTDRRKGVIQQATTKSGTIFTADSETLRERIKERNRQANIRKSEPETNWSPYTDVGYNLLESGEEDTVPPATTNVVVEFKKRSVPVAPQVHTPEPTVVNEQQEYLPTEPPKETLVVEEPEPIIEKTVEIPNETELVTKLTTPPKPTVIVVKEREGEIEVSEPKQTSTESIVTTEPLEGKEVSAETLEDEEVSTETSDSITTNQLTMYISTGLSLIVITVFFAWIILGNQTNKTDIDQATSLTQTTNVERYIITEDFTINELRTFTTTQIHTELVLVNTLDEKLTSVQVFELITPDLPSSIHKYVTDVRFIQTQYETQTPQLVITISDPTSVRGTLFTNENNLADAMTLLYGALPTESFTDQTIDGIDVRTLGDSSLTYGIINDDTLLIAHSPNAFQQIVTLLQN